MRFLFCSLDNYGFLFSSIGVAEALRRRGHEIAFVADEKLSGLLEKAGFRRLPRGTPDGPSFLLRHSGDPLEILRQVRHVERALEHFPADVLVTQQPAFGPYIAAERTRRPIATLGPAAYLWPTAVPPDEPWFREYVARRYRGFYLTCEVTREMLGMKRHVHDLANNPLTGDLFLLRSVPELEGDMSHRPPRVHCVGDCLWEMPVSPEPALLEWLSQTRDSGMPLLYVQPGRAITARPSWWARLVDALRNKPVRVVAAVGRMDGAVGALPENFFARPHVPQSLILPLARAVISSATTTPVLGALVHGLPLLLIPGEGAEQLDVMMRCVRAGVALHIPDEEVSPEGLHRQIEVLLSREELHARAAVIQAAFRRAGGPMHAAELLEGLGRQRAWAPRGAMIGAGSGPDTWP